MTITADLAGLIAQVYPVLILAIAIEGQKHEESLPFPKWLRITRHMVRLFAVNGGLLSTFTCLLIVGGHQEVTPFAYFLVWFSGVLLFTVFLYTTTELMAGSLFRGIAHAKASDAESPEPLLDPVPEPTPDTEKASTQAGSRLWRRLLSRL